MAYVTKSLILQRNFDKIKAYMSSLSKIPDGLHDSLSQMDAIINGGKWVELRDSLAPKRNASDKRKSEKFLCISYRKTVEIQGWDALVSHLGLRESTIRTRFAMENGTLYRGPVTDIERSKVFVKLNRCPADVVEGLKIQYMVDEGPDKRPRGRRMVDRENALREG